MRHEIMKAGERGGKKKTKQKTKLEKGGGAIATTRTYRSHGTGAVSDDEGLAGGDGVLAVVEGKGSGLGADGGELRDHDGRRHRRVPGRPGGRRRDHRPVDHGHRRRGDVGRVLGGGDAEERAERQDALSGAGRHFFFSVSLALSFYLSFGDILLCFSPI